MLGEEAGRGGRAERANRHYKQRVSTGTSVKVSFNGHGNGDGGQGAGERSCGWRGHRLCALVSGVPARAGLCGGGGGGDAGRGPGLCPTLT